MSKIEDAEPRSVEGPEPRRIKVYFDGNKTPEAVSCSYVLIDGQTNKQKEDTIKLPNETTVPQAEYHGLIHALKSFKKNSLIPLK